MKNRLDAAKRIVIKLGSALIVDGQSGKLRSDWLKTLGDDIARLTSAGKEVVIVSSGAAALGRVQVDIF